MLKKWAFRLGLYEAGRSSGFDESHSPNFAGVHQASALKIIYVSISCYLSGQLGRFRKKLRPDCGG
jgi:hypothetical protein